MNNNLEKKISDDEKIFEDLNKKKLQLKVRYEVDCAQIDEEINRVANRLVSLQKNKMLSNKRSREEYLKEEQQISTRDEEYKEDYINEDYEKPYQNNMLLEIHDEPKISKFQKQVNSIRPDECPNKKIFSSQNKIQNDLKKKLGRPFNKVNKDGNSNTSEMNSIKKPTINKLTNPNLSKRGRKPKINPILEEMQKGSMNEFPSQPCLSQDVIREHLLAQTQKVDPTPYYGQSKNTLIHNTNSNSNQHNDHSPRNNYSNINENLSPKSNDSPKRIVKPLSNEAQTLLFKDEGERVVGIRRDVAGRFVVYYFFICFRFKNYWAEKIYSSEVLLKKNLQLLY